MSQRGKGFAKAPTAAGSVSSLEDDSPSLSDTRLGRRRKIRCQYDAGSESVCIGCRTRGSRCRSQEFIQDEPSDAALTVALGERVGRFENMVEALMQKVDAIYDRLGSGSQAPSKSPPSLGIDVVTPCATPGHPHETAPLLSLFDNTIVCVLHPILNCPNEKTAQVRSQSYPK